MVKVTTGTPDGLTSAAASAARKRTVGARNISDYPWMIRLFFWKQKRKYGRVLDPGLFWGRSPWVFAAVALLYGALDFTGCRFP